MTEEQAFELFREVRWGRDGDPVCPDCGVVDWHWFLASRRQWRCRACGHTTSVTCGTILAYHKLPLSTDLAAIVIYTVANGRKSAIGESGKGMNPWYR